MGVSSTDEHPLAALFEPKSIAVIGASSRAGSVGARVFANLLASGYAGRVHAVNPKHRAIGAQRCHARIGDVGEPITLAVIAVPAARIDAVVDDCAAAGVAALIVVSAGFAELGDEGRTRQAALVARVRAHGMRMLGPNCFGLMRPRIGLDATFGASRPPTGALALVSQSGGVCAALVDWARAERIGLSAMVSLGAAADLDFGELIDWLVGDPATHAIMLYVEGVRDARAFLSAVRAAVPFKPVVVLKGGRRQGSRDAVSSHTGALAGDEAVFDAALARVGAVRVDSLAELFAAANALASAPLPAGPRLAVLSNGGGPGVLAVDRAQARGLALATFAESTVAALRAALPAAASLANPVDVLGDADPTRYVAALRALQCDPGVDGVAALFVPQGLADADAVARAVIEAVAGSPKPVVAAWMGADSVASAHEAFEDARIAHCHSPETAVSAFATLAAARSARSAALRPLAAAPDAEGGDVATALALRDAAVAAGREWLVGADALRLLAAFGVPVPPFALAVDADAAVAAARRLGHPVALKLQSPDIVHKSDVGGLALDLAGDTAVDAAARRLLAQARERAPAARVDGLLVQPFVRFDHAREVLVGIANDPVFGRVIGFGAGGIAVEVLRDVAWALPPLGVTDAEELIARPRIAALLGAYRRVPAADRDALVDAVRRVANLACLLPWVVELDANPLLAHPGGATIVDARVRIDAAAPRHDPHCRHLAIHPYPIAEEGRFVDARGGAYAVRPIRAEDAGLERTFIDGLSPASRRRRFHEYVREASDAMVARFTRIDYDREMAFVALPEEVPTRFAGVGRYAPARDPRDCEFAIAVADEYQGRSLGAELLARLVQHARGRGYRRMTGLVLAENAPMLDLARRLGFRAESADEPTEVEVVLDLQGD